MVLGVPILKHIKGNQHFGYPTHSHMINHILTAQNVQLKAENASVIFQTLQWLHVNCTCLKQAAHMCSLTWHAEFTVKVLDT